MASYTARMTKRLGSRARRAAAACGLALLPAVALAADVRSEQSRVLANLLKLHGQAVSMLYSPGALDRAAHVQDRLSALEIDARKWSGVALGLRGVVLAPEDWQTLRLELPYGLPQPMSEGIAVPAWGDQHSVALWQRLLGGALPWPGGEPIRGSRDEAASLALADTFLQVECGRALAAKALPVNGPEWIRELVAHVVALTAVAVHEPERLDAIAAVYAGLGARAGAPGAVAEYSATLPLERRLAYQPAFFRGAQLVVAADGRRAAKKVLALPKKAGGQLTEGDLVKHYPALREWLRGGA